MNFQISDALRDTFGKLFSALPNLFAAVVVFLVGMIIVKLLRKLIKKLLDKVGVDKLGEKLQKIDIIEKSNISIRLSNIFSQAFYYFMMLFVTIISTDILGLEVVSNLVSDVFNFIPNLLVSLIILIFGTLLADLIKKLVLTTLNSLGLPSAKMISNFVFYFLFINILVSALTQSGIETAFLAQNITMLIGGAVLAFAISYGLAAKTSVSNYLATFYIKDKLEIGDTISFGDIKGTIIDIDKSSCIIKTVNGKTVIPLSKLTQNSIEVIS